jgi:uncharacterized protein (TIGR03032 family)
MRLEQEFIKLPLHFDAARLAIEIAPFGEEDWRPHPEGHPGNWALPLVAAGGDPANDGVRGPMRPTPFLERCPYVREVLASLRAPIGRTRLMRIDGNSEATPHLDSNYYWMRRARVHVPVITDPAVRFLCGTRETHMAPGEAWIFDTWKTHNVINPNPTRRIHLVADTVGSPAFWQMVTTGLAPQTDASHDIEFESENFPVVMSPEEQGGLIRLVDDLPAASQKIVERFLDDWRHVWQQHGPARSGWAEYRELLDRLDKALPEHPTSALVRHMFVHAAFNPQLAPPEPVARPRTALRRLDQPVFVISSPRSGSSLLFETLSGAPGVFTPGGESHAIIEGIEALHPAHRDWESNRLTARDATPEVVRTLENRFLAALRDRDANTRLPERVRMLEKTPKNALRIPFLQAAFPDALFIYLYRDPRATLSSMLEAWRSGRFVTYPDLPGWEGPPWSLLLTPGWQALSGRPLAEVVAQQWETTTRTILDDLESLPADQWCVASYDRLVGEPQAEIERLCAFLGFAWDRQLTAPLPFSKHTLTPPDPAKAQRNGPEIDTVFKRIEATAERALEIHGRPPAKRHRIPATLPPAEPAAAPFRSIHTSSFPEILTALRASLLVSTYQSGRVVLVRARDGKLNTHLSAFQSPMGIAIGTQGLAIGTARHVWDYRNLPALTDRLEAPGTHDACFVPRNAHVTGDVRIHELAFDGQGELWFVNTRFSTLCTLDRDHSFVPRWRPPFVSGLAPEDRCHLNGMAMIGGRPRLVTALGETDTPHGWREKKVNGGVIVDVDTGHVVVRGLSMPHSPRWYANRLWVLESGRGTLNAVDLQRERVDVVAQLPGFTRGLAFAGHYAFIGLSQVRESVFEGIPLAQRLRADDRACGVWAVDIRSGNIVAFLKFEGQVQEIFDVQVLAGVLWPELLEPEADVLATTFALPKNALGEVVRK